MIEQLSEPAAGFVRTINANHAGGFADLFAEDAVVDDAGRTIRGREAIQAWAASDIFAVSVRFTVLKVSGGENDVTLTAKVDGTFDRTGLPNPLIMTMQIVARDRMIRGLTCRLAVNK